MGFHKSLFEFFDNWVELLNFCRLAVDADERYLVDAHNIVVINVNTGFLDSGHIFRDQFNTFLVQIKLFSNNLIPFSYNLVHFVQLVQ